MGAHIEDIVELLAKYTITNQIRQLLSNYIYANDIVRN